MSYVFYNPNPSGKRVGDCVIRAIAKLTGRTWEEAYVAVTAQGFTAHDMPSSNAVWGEYLRSIGYVRNILPNTCPDCYTVKAFCAEHPRGAYLLATGTHAVTAIDGNYYDAWDSGDETPIYYFSKGA